MLATMIACVILKQGGPPRLPESKAALLIWDRAGRGGYSKSYPDGIILSEAVWADGTIVWVDAAVADAMKTEKRSLCRIGHIDRALVNRELTHLYEEGYFKAAGWSDLVYDAKTHFVLVRTHGKVLSLQSYDDPPRSTYNKNWKNGWRAWKLAHDAAGALRPVNGPIVTGPTRDLFWKWEGEATS